MMQILILSSKGTRHRYLQIPTLVLWIAGVIFLLMAGVWLSGVDTTETQALPVASLPLQNKLTCPIQTVAQRPALEPKQGQYIHTSTPVDPVYAKKLGELQAEAIRLKALMERIAQEAGVDISSFDIAHPPAAGGVERTGTMLSQKEMNQDVIQLQQQFQQQSRYMAQLQSVLTARQTLLSALPTGLPVLKKEGSWLSSRYGYRIDPFTGKKTFHRGLDFAGKAGSTVKAVADGVVLWVGKRKGYGYMIDIDHGNGYVTRYAHNREVLVHRGQQIKKGQVIAKMGTTGRSTGPHVHFEVIKDGNAINPYPSIKG